MCYNLSTKKIGKETQKQIKVKIDPAFTFTAHYYLSWFTNPLLPVLIKF
jgi:hypothetical protein